MPKIGSPLSILRVDPISNFCFSVLMKPSYNFKNLDNLDNFLYSRRGVEIKLYGFTEGTKLYNDCGANAICNLLPLPL